MSSATTVIDQIDAKLAIYYAKRDRNDYKNNKGIGKFKQFANECGFGDDDQIKEELESVECTLVDFDTKDDKNMFPIIPPIQDETKRNIEILRVLRKFAGINKPNLKGKSKPMKKYKDELTNKYPDVNICIGITKDEIDKTRKKYGLFLGSKTVEKDKVLIYFLAVGQKIRYPFLTYMVDSYTNDNAKLYAKNSTSMPVKDWVVQNKFWIQLRDKKSERAEELKQAMQNYSIRIMSRLKFKTTYKIKDNLERIVEYIVSTAVFLKKLMDKLYGLSPFQVDLLIAVNGCESMVQDTPIPKVSVLSDDEKDEQKYNLNTKDKHIGDIRQKLKEFPLYWCIGHTESAKKQNIKYEKAQHKEKTVDTIVRNFTLTYNDFTSILSKNHKKYDFSTYPQRRRFSIFVDCRKTNEDQKSQDNEITYFQPPNDCNTMEKNSFPEIGFDFVRKCLIPKLKTEPEHINALDGLCGELMTFMFHVEQGDEIRCYIIWNGQTMRFQSEHITKILPNLFVRSEENTKFITGENAKQLESKFKTIICDRLFDPFYKKVTIFS